MVLRRFARASLISCNACKFSVTAFAGVEEDVVDVVGADAEEEDVVDVVGGDAGEEDVWGVDLAIMSASRACCASDLFVVNERSRGSET
jgi:hypothetical protein